jgi:peptidoglycan hydrolase-like protein with peptidoglycan-binding domain
MFGMKPLRSGVIGMIAASTLWLCSVAFSEADQTQPKAKQGAPQPTKKTLAASHKSTKSIRPTSHTASATATSRKGKKAKKVARRGQQKIDSERTQQIQEALIREHYMSGEPSGKWDASTEDALRRFQADHGWQNKTVPDSRALIKLGLGPNHDHLLNPESAMTTAPDAPRTNRAPAHTQTPAASSNQPQQ